MEKYSKDNSTEFECGVYNFSVAGQFHCHNRVEIFRILKGKIRMCFDIKGIVYDAYEGDYVIIKSSEIHRIFTSRSTTIEYILFPLSFQALYDNSYIRSSFIIPSEVVKADDDVKKLVDSIFIMAKKQYSDLRTSVNTSSSAVNKSLCTLLCSLLIEMYPKRRTTVSLNGDSSENTIPNTAENISFETIEKFDALLLYINKNYCDNRINLSELSKFSGINKTYLSSLFPKLTGKHFTSHMHHLRINRAISLMHECKKNVSEIAYACGFETIRSFNNVFKSETGVTPSAFLSALSGKETHGANISVSAVGKDIFDYDWTSNVDLELDKDTNTAHVICRNTSSKLWCHLRLDMVLFAGQSYRITYKAKTLSNPHGVPASYKYINCTFHFPDSVTNTPFHHAENLRITELDDGWMEYTASFTVPEYYIPSTDDVFSLYSSPAVELGVSFLAKDITVERIL